MNTQCWEQQVADGAVLLTVNQRLSRDYLRRYNTWQEGQGRQFWETPSILPWSAWLRQVHSELLACGESTLALMHDLAEHRLWHACLQQDEALSPLLDVDAAARGAQRARRIVCTWQLDRQPAAPASIDQLAFSRWHRRFLDRCKDLQLIDESSLSDHLVHCFKVGSATRWRPDRILLAGVLDTTPQQQALLDQLMEQGSMVEFLQPNRTAVITRRLAADDAGELTDIARQTLQALDERPTARLGVVIGDLAQRRAAVLRAFDAVYFPGCNPDEVSARVRPYDVSLGLPLNEQACVRTALLALRLRLNGLSESELSAFLLSPYLGDAAAESRKREALDRSWREQRIRRLDLSGMIQAMPSTPRLRKRLSMLQRQGTVGAATSSVWAERFGAWMAALDWPGTALDSVEYQAVQAWYACLDDLQVLDDGTALDAGAAQTLVQRLCRDRVFQPETPGTPLQIMGRLESHGLEFDSLWIAGLDADQWPAPGNPSPFLPMGLQKAAGVPDASAELRLDVAEREMAAWQRCADAIVLSHAEVRGGAELVPAAVAAQVPEQPVAGVDAGLETLAARIQQSADLECLEDNRGPAVQPGTRVRGGARLLENQARCPFKAFALHRLEIKPLEEAGLGLDARQHGTLLHKALELFWERTESHRALMALDDASLDARIVDVIDAALADDRNRLPIGDELIELERRRVKRLMREWIDSSEKPRQPFTVVGRELDDEIEREGVRMRLQIDRIDRLDSGETVIVDYKTGTSNHIKGWSEERIENPQLPLYAMTNDSVDGICFAQVARHKYAYIGITTEAGLLPGTRSEHDGIDNWADWRQHWQQAIDTVAADLQSGIASVTPAPKACDYCDLKPVCRIRSVLVDDEDDPTVTGNAAAVSVGNSRSRS